MPSTLKDIYNHLWALLEASSDFTSAFTERRRIKATSFDARAKMDTYFADADLPNIRMLPGRYVSSGFDKAQSFAMEGTTFLDNGGDAVIERTAEFGITIVHKSLTIGGDGDIDDLVNICEEALLQGGPRLNLDYVRSWGKTSVAYKIQSSGEAEGTERMIATIGFPVVTLFEIRDVLGL